MEGLFILTIYLSFNPLCFFFYLLKPITEFTDVMNFKLKIHKCLFNFYNIFRFIYGSNPLHYSSYLLLFLLFIHFFWFQVSITRESLTTFNPMFTKEFIIDIFFILNYTWRYYFEFQCISEQMKILMEDLMSL